MTTMSKDLFLALLAMDSYNRGYDPHITLHAITIGVASVVQDSLKLNEDPNVPDRVDEAAGFYTISYDVSAVAGFESGDIVISYRGTDSGNGVWNGWTTCLGYPGQSDLATQFYLDVVADLQNAPGGQTGDVILTGHSLGGALAGGMQ